MATEETTSAGLEQELADMLEIERFDPPEDFRRRALIQDEAVYEEAESDPSGWWAKQAGELLDWAQPWDQVLDDTNAPFYKWFTGGKLNASYNCVDRHVEAGHGDRVASTGAVRRARSARSPTPICTATCSASPTH